MANLKFDYVDPIPLQKLGNEIDGFLTINIPLAQVAGKYYDRIKRLDTGEEWTEYIRPVPFVIQLDAEGMNKLLGVIMPYAGAQDVLRPATPVLDTAPTAPPEPPPPTPLVGVDVIPDVATVAPNGTVQLQAIVTNIPGGGNAAVEWFVRQGDLGSVDQGGLYTAPETPGTYRVLARSLQDNTSIDFCDVTVA